MTHRITPAEKRERESAELGSSRLLLWFVLLMVAFWPRLWIVGFWIFSRQLGNAFSSWIVPALGFLFLPWTTLLYAFMWGINSDGVHGWEWGFVVIAFLVDVWFWLAARRSLR
jgi:hypothetical protein